MLGQALQTPAKSPGRQKDSRFVADVLKEPQAIDRNIRQESQNDRMFTKSKVEQQKYVRAIGGTLVDILYKVYVAWMYGDQKHGACYV